MLPFIISNALRFVWFFFCCCSFLSHSLHCRIVLFECCLSGFIFSITFPREIHIRKMTNNNNNNDVKYSTESIYGETQRNVAAFDVFVCDSPFHVGLKRNIIFRSDKCFNSDSISWMQFFNVIGVCYQYERMVCIENIIFGFYLQMFNRMRYLQLGVRHDMKNGTIALISTIYCIQTIAFLLFFSLSQYDEFSVLGPSHR